MKTLTQFTQLLNNKFTKKNVIAPVESSSTASQAYTVGKKFFYNNILYKATADIAQGGLIVPDTNCTPADNIIDQIENKTVVTDPVPTKNSTNPVQSGGVYNSLDPVYNVLGAKNLLQNNATSQTINGVTCTVNSDGSISTNGVYTGSDGVLLRINENFTVPQSGEYILTGTPFTQQEWTFLLYITDNSSGSILAIDLGQGVNYSLDSSKSYSVVLWCKPNFDTSGYNIKPMIRPASIEYDTYVPFAKTNQQLTKEIVSIYKQDIQPTKDSISGVYYVAKSAVTGKEGVIGFWLQGNNDLIITRMWENDYNYYFFIRECNSSFTPYTGTAPTITVSTYD